MLLAMTVILSFASLGHARRLVFGFLFFRLLRAPLLYLSIRRDRDKGKFFRGVIFVVSINNECGAGCIPQCISN